MQIPHRKACSTIGSNTDLSCCACLLYYILLELSSDSGAATFVVYAFITRTYCYYLCHKENLLAITKLLLEF